jgi:hypothetical protein
MSSAARGSRSPSATHTEDHAGQGARCREYQAGRHALGVALSSEHEPSSSVATASASFANWEVSLRLPLSAASGTPGSDRTPVCRT